MDVPTAISPGERRLRAAAMRYLERYSSTTARLRRVLRRRVQRAEATDGPWPHAEAEIDGVVAWCVAQGWLDDAAWAKQRAETLSRRGRSRRAVQQGLQAEGLGGDAVAEAVAALDDDLEAALRYARRRRLPLGDPDPDVARANRQRALAALARQGFPYDVARRALDALSAGERA